MKKLIYLTLQSTNEGQAGYAHVYEIIKGLRNQNWEVELFDPWYSSRENKPGPFIRLLTFVWIQFKLFFKSLSNKPNAIYIRNHFASIFTALWAKIIRKPVIQEVNSPYEDLFIAWPKTRALAPLFKWLIRVQLQLADAVVVVTPQLKEWVKSESEQNSVHVIPNAANQDIFHPEAVLKYDLPDPYVVFFGALAEWQGLKTLVEAVKSPQWPDEVELVVAGDGVCRATVEESSDKNSHISYLGKVPYHSVPGIVANSIAGVSPQNNEGGRSETGLYPLKVFETMACGVPIVVTDFPGMGDLVRENKCGIVIPCENPTKLAEAVQFLYINPEDRNKMGNLGRQAVEQNHSWEQRAKKVKDIVHSLVIEKND